jgi:hypothetical protein
VSGVALGSIAVVVVLVVVLVAVKITSTSTPGTATAPVERPASAAVLGAVTGISVAEMDAVGLPGTATAPLTDRSQPPLVLGGKPGSLYIGGEFCPLCAAERWAVVAAFSKFGSFTGLTETTSSPWDGTPYATFSFRSAVYSSSLVAFEPVEYEGNDTHGSGTHSVLHPLTPGQSALWATYSDKFEGGQEGFPFLDIGNRVIAMGASYDPTVLAGLTQAEIARKLSDPSDPVTQGIVGAMNSLTAGICSLTGGSPAAVCSSSGVTSARRALGLP